VQEQLDRIAVIIEDDVDIRRLLEEVLEHAGFATHSAGNGLDGIELVRRHAPILTTLDVSMPGIDGFETAKRIRAFSETYLIMLSARSEEIDTLMGLESGADDYIAKPFRPRELRARIDAMLRRPRLARLPGGPLEHSDSQGSISGVVGHATDPAGHVLRQLEEQSRTATSVAVDDWLEHRGLRLHPEMRLVVLDGVEIELTRSEFELLNVLMSSGRRVRSKPELALALRTEEYLASDYVSDADKRAVEVHLANLRRKLGENAAHPRWIETVRGVGYRLTADGGE
jgi:two-component system OmpR family response regulator